MHGSASRERMVRAIVQAGARFSRAREMMPGPETLEHRGRLAVVRRLTQLIVSRAGRLVTACLVLACGPAAPAAEQKPTTPVVSSAPAAGGASAGSPSLEVRKFGGSVGFRSRDNLRDHFIKHGREFGAITMDAYLTQAQTLRDASIDDRVLELARDDGVFSRFDRDSGSFLAFNADGTIRTFFRPNDGERYFRRQARRRPIP